MTNELNISRRAFVAGGLVVSGGTTIGSMPVGAADHSSTEYAANRPRVVDFRARPPFKSLRRMVPDKMLGLAPGTSDEEAMARFLEQMQDAEIDLTVAFGRTVPAAGAMQTTTSNDDIAELLSLYPGRFAGFGSVDVRSPQKAMAEVDRCAGLGLKGIVFDNSLSLPALHNDDPTLIPIYERCVQNDLIIAIHSSGMLGPDLTFSDPARIQRVAKLFPLHPFVVTHACWPFAAEMIAIVMAGLMLGEANIYYQCDYATLENVPGVDVYLESTKFEGMDIYKKAIYGSSFPFYIPIKNSIEKIRGYNFGRSIIKESILGGNASALLKI